MLFLEIGGGTRSLGGNWVNCDMIESADVIHDLDKYPWPFSDHSVDQVYSSHCLEHLDDPHKAQNEIARICKIGADVEIRVPHPNSHLAMTHGHKTVVSPVQIVNTDIFFPEDFWKKEKRLKLQKIDYAPTFMLEIAKRQLSYTRGLSDRAIMNFIPGTCHEARMFFRVEENIPSTETHQQRHSRAVSMLS